MTTLFSLEGPLRGPWRPALSLLGLLGLFGFPGCGKPADHAVAQLEAPGAGKAAARVRVRLGEFTRGDISSTLQVSADLEARREADVYPQLSGVAREVRYREGDFVEAGEPVVVLQDDELRWVEENKKILVEQAQTKLELAQLATREAAALVDMKELLLTKATREYDRLARLAEGGQGAISLEEVETKKFDVDEARGNLLTAQLALERAKLEETQVKQTLELARVEHSTASWNLSRTRITAPVSGCLSTLDLKPGELVGPTTLAFSVADLDSLEARVYVPQRELSRLRVSQRVRITSEVYPGEEFWGAVEVINPVIDKQSGTVRLLVKIDDDRDLLKPGMFINAEIILDTHRQALLVAKKAVTYDNREPILYLVEGGKARRYVLSPGYSSPEFIEVLGLTGMEGRPGDPEAGRLVLVGQSNLKDGDLVDAEE